MRKIYLCLHLREIKAFIKLLEEELPNLSALERVYYNIIHLHP